MSPALAMKGVRFSSSSGHGQFHSDVFTAPFSNALEQVQREAFVDNYGTRYTF